MEIFNWVKSDEHTANILIMDEVKESGKKKVSTGEVKKKVGREAENKERGEKY